MRAARFSEWAALRDNRMDLVFTEQREQAQGRHSELCARIEKVQQNQ